MGVGTVPKLIAIVLCPCMCAWEPLLAICQNDQFHFFTDLYIKGGQNAACSHCEQDCVQKATGSAPTLALAYLVLGEERELSKLKEEKQTKKRIQLKYPMCGFQTIPVSMQVFFFFSYCK